MSTENPQPHHDHDHDPGGGPPENPYQQRAKAAAAKAGLAAKDALAAARRLVTDPVNAIGTANAGLGQERVLGVAVIFALVAAIGLALAGGLIARAAVGAIMGAPGAIYGFSFGFGAFLKSVLIWLVTIIAAGGGVLLFAPLLGGRSSPASALLVAATAYLPLGIAALLSAIVGAIFTNRLGMILVMLLLLYGVCYLIIVLNAGLRRAAGVDERKAVFGTPTVLAFAILVSGLVSWLLS